MTTNEQSKNDKPNKEITEKQKKVVGILMLLFLLLFLYLIFNMNNNSSNSKDTYQGTITSYSLVNPASIKFTASVKNTSSADGKYNCKVKGSDASGIYEGFDYFSDENKLKSGETRNFNGTLVIKNEGSKYITQVSIDCN